MRFSLRLALPAFALSAAPLLAAPPTFENGTPVGTSTTDTTAQSETVTGNPVRVRVDLNQAVTYEHPLVGHFHSLERSEQLSAVDSDGLQVDVAMVDVAPFGTYDNLPAPGVTQAATSNPVIHMAWIEETGVSAGSFWNGGITPVYQVLYASSDDLGDTFSGPVSVSGAITYHPITNGPFSTLDLEVDSGGQPRVSYAFVSTADQTRSRNVYLAYSQDGGENWATPLVVNDLTTAGNTEGRQCAFPRLVIDDRDNIFVSYVRGVSTGGGLDDVMLAKVNRGTDPFTMVPVGSQGTVGSTGGVRLTPDGARQAGPDLALGDGDALHLVYYNPTANQVQHKRMATDTTWTDVTVSGWDEAGNGAAVFTFDDDAVTNGALDQSSLYVFPTLAVDRSSSPDRVYALMKWGSGADQSIRFNQYYDDGTSGTSASWGTAAPVWSTGAAPLFSYGNQRYNVELNWTIAERVAAQVDDRRDDGGDLHIAFTAGYSSAGVGGEHDVYYAMYNGSSWTLPEKVADDDSDGTGTEDGLAAGDTYLLSPSLAVHPESENVFLAFGAGSGEGLGGYGVTDVDHHPYFKVLGRDLTWEDVSIPVGGYQYTLTYEPTNPQTPGATLANKPVYAHAADPVTGVGLGATGSAGDGFLTGNWERVGTSLQDTDKQYEGLVDDVAGSSDEWGDDGDKLGLLVKLNVLGSDSSTNVKVITGGTASARSVHVSGTLPPGLAVGQFFAMGADIDIVPANAGPTVTIDQPDGVNDLADTLYTIEYTLNDIDDDLDSSLQAALYAYPSAGLRTVQDIRIFGTLIADENDRILRNAAGTNDLEQGDDDYTWDDPPSGLKTSSLFASIFRMSSGTYYIYLVVDDGQNPPAFAVSPGPVTIAHSPLVRQLDPPVAQTVDTGMRTGLSANPYDLDFSVVDYDSDARIQLFYSAFTGLTSVSATGTYPSQSFVLGKSLSGTRSSAIMTTTSLSEADREYTWDVAEPLVPEGTYYLYAVATDSTNVSVKRSPAQLTVRHSPSFSFYEPPRNTQRSIDSGSQPIYTIQWQKGAGDRDIDDNGATIALYFTTVDPATTNFTGTDSTALLGAGSATLIAGPILESADGAADMYVWDFRTTTSAPLSGQQVWLYAVATDDAGNVAVELGGSLVVNHSPYVLLKTRLPTVSQGDIVRLEWEDYLVDDGLGTDDAYLRLYATRLAGLASLAELEASVTAGNAYVINSSDGTASGASVIRESDASAYNWDTYTSTFSLPQGTYSVYAGISADSTVADNTTGRVSVAANQLAVGPGAGATPHMVVSPNRVAASPGDVLTFNVVMQSQGVPANAYSVAINVPPAAFEVVNGDSPFVDLGAILTGGTELENTTAGSQLRFAKTGPAEVIGTEADPVAAVQFQVKVKELTGTQYLALDDVDAAITIVGRSVPLRRTTGLSAVDGQVQSLPRGRLRAFVRLEGRAPPLGNGNHSTLMDVHLRPPGSVFDVDDSAFVAANDDYVATADTVEVETAEDGGLVLESVPSGRYVLTLKDTSHLSGRTDTITIRAGESLLLTSDLGLYASDIRGDPSFLLSQDGRLLQAGDVTEDNEIDEDDINALDAAWGTDPGAPRFAQADVNNDSRVDVADLTAAISNISNTTGFGAPPVYKRLGSGGRGLANTAATAELLAPNHRGGWWAGNEIDLVVVAHELEDLAAYSLELTYDPLEMELVGVDGQYLAGSILAPNPAGYYSRAEHEDGRIFLAAARRGKEWSARGSGELLRFRARLNRDGIPASLQVRDGVLLSTGYESQPIRLGDLWKAVLPTELALSQNYPNPFNPTTTIPFTVPVPPGREAAAMPGAVRLEIFNALGQRVRTLVDDDREAGFYRVRWDGRDGSGHEVASGLYLYRLQARHEVQLARMMLVR